MIDFEKLGHDAHRAMFMLELAHERIVCDDRISEEEVDEYLRELDAGFATTKAIFDELAKASGDFCNGFVAARQSALAAGRQWSDERAEKIALLRLSGDDTPEEQIPV